MDELEHAYELVHELREALSVLIAASDRLLSSWEDGSPSEQRESHAAFVLALALARDVNPF